MPRSNSLIETMTTLQASHRARQTKGASSSPARSPVRDRAGVKAGAQPLRRRGGSAASSSSPSSSSSPLVSPRSPLDAPTSDTPMTDPDAPIQEVHDPELQAFLAWLSSLSPSPVHTLPQLTDGSALLLLLSLASPSHFPLPARTLSPQDPWPLRLTQLKALYRRVGKWYAERGAGPGGEEWTPDLQLLISPDAAPADITTTTSADAEKAIEAAREKEALKLLRLTIGIAVQGEDKERAVEAIRSLGTGQQTALMQAIERVMHAFPPKVETEENQGDTSVMTDDDHYYQIQSARSRLQSENASLQAARAALQSQVESLQTTNADLQAERDDALATAREMRERAEEKRGEKMEGVLRGEIERLKDELRKSEDNLSSAEATLQRQERDLSDLSRRTADLQSKADEAQRLKDQVDEWRHAAERAQKNENVIEKYKKKLEETADLRRQVKTLTEQNTQLVNTNSQLESQSSKSANVKPLLDAYKQQISELESKASSRAAEAEGLRVKLEEERRARQEVERMREEERREAEQYVERVRELESLRTPRRERKLTNGSGEEPQSPGMEEMGEPLTLDDALSGTTMTDLKLRIRALEREVQEAQNANGTASRVLVLENLLEDANRLKARYEKEYLAAHREALVLKREVEEIRAGRGGAESGEMVIALRKRLNEVVDELDGLKKQFEQQGVELEGSKKELTIARSDLNLVNKDQLEILASLRASVSSDNAGLSSELDRLKQVERELREKNRMQMEQVNNLLMEKIELQGEGIGQREAMLRRERDIGDLRASIAGKDLPEDTKKRLIELAEENARLKEEAKVERQKLIKARQFIKEQDELFSKQHAGKVDPNTFTEAEHAYKAQIQLLEDKIALLKRTIKENAAAYDREKQQLQSSFRVLGSQQRQTQLRSAVSRNGTRLQPQSWLAQQRETMMANLSR
ncbi:HOOK-domain-containing protein [Calocera cornea HHB12733]|uniref:HOOK-domain-containing protein n=1 Tax=Calocera cornea HHB12733 TaxID=1353952 RepID=A0A165JVZ3_9BASI|nr:HOOK-domain-containing protein [Calocera cornea HHB12733]